MVLMSKEQYSKIFKEIKIPNVTTIREDIIRVCEARLQLYLTVYLQDNATSIQ